MQICRNSNHFPHFQFTLMTNDIIDEILLMRAKDNRSYFADFDYAGYVKNVWNQLNVNYPGQVIGNVPQVEGREMILSDFWVVGDGGHATLAQSYNLTLPTDYLHFTQRFRNYALILRNCIHLENSAAVHELTKGLRQGENISLDSPHFLYRFAEIPGTSSNFMFRWHSDGSFRDVAFAHYSDSSELEILGVDSDIYSCDTNFTNWFTRMVVTDGAPLHLKFLAESDFFVKRKQF
jgi:hypothetical protein